MKPVLISAALVVLLVALVVVFSTRREVATPSSGVPNRRTLANELQAKTDELQAMIAAREAKLRAKGCTVSDKSGWTVESCLSKMDGKKTVSVGKDQLIIRCTEGREAEAYISLDTVVQRDYETNSQTVRVKLDEGPPVSQRWGASTDRQALFSPAPRKFAEQLTKAQRLYVEYRPFDETKTVFEANVSGLSDVLPNVAQTCNWHAADARAAAAARERAASEAARAADDARATRQHETEAAAQKVRDAVTEKVRNCEHLEFSCTTMHSDGACRAYNEQCKSQ